MKVCNINSNWHWSGSLANSMEMPAGHAVLFFLPLFYKQSSMKNIHDCWQVPVCGLCFSQFSPWKPQMVGIRMTMADIIIQMVLVVADREQWWWCALLRDDDVSSSCETKMNHLTLCYGWIPALIYLSSFFFFFSFIPAVFPSLARAATEVANISRTRFVIKMSPGQTWLGNSGWGWVKETHSGLCSTVGLSRSTRLWQDFSGKIPNMGLSSCNTRFLRNSHHVSCHSKYRKIQRESWICMNRLGLSRI